jgi:U3 small nucleolar RNA-associated protein MPP10
MSNPPPEQNGPLLPTLTAIYPILQPTQDLQQAALALAKRYLDPLASEVSEAQIQRLKDLRKKRKRGDEEVDFRPLQLKKVHLEGFKVDQVYEQTRRVVKAAEEDVELFMPKVWKNLSNGTMKGPKAVQFEDEESEIDSLDNSNDDEELVSDAPGFSDSDAVEQAEESDSDMEEQLEDEGLEDITAEEDHFRDGVSEEEEAAEEYIPDPHGLNDGFFSIDDFNKQTDFLEQQDARGDPDDGAASDEEDIDWDADPTIMPSHPSNGTTGQNEDEDSGSEEDEEGGPTFGNFDLDAPEGASDDEGADEEAEEDMELDDMNDISNANNVMYKDFFTPPAKKGGHRAGKRGAPMKHNFPAGYKKPANPDDAEEDVKRAMSSVHRDLFSDDSEVENDTEHALSDVDPADPKSRRSTHERRQAKLLSEIRKLEAENVAKRSWTMSGEARAADRPLNSLLEEDLDFERAGKPVPVITQEISEDIEALIKRRILAQEFDEVLRRRPDEILTGQLARRGRMQDELADSKSKKGLAELYEDEHLKKTDPNYTDPRNEKLKAEHAEIESLWRDVSGKLDSLCSWHYRPRPAEVSVQVRSDAPVISMEDARPSGIGGNGDVETTQLAPQEVYKPGEEKARDEIVTKGGAVVKRDELSREQKLRRRRREKERARKAGENGNSSKKPESKKSKEKKDVVGDLKKGGVMVIGRKGEIRDVEGNAFKGSKKAMTAGGFKL